jgi:DNA polymerase-3 subunit beta
MKADLLNKVQIVSRAVPNKTTMSILECILIQAHNDTITMIANDMELGIETYLDGTVLEEGTIALDAKMLLDIVRKLPENEVTLEVFQDLKTLISCEKAKFTIMGKDGEDFSYLPQIQRDKSIEISQYSLREAIKQTIFSITESDRLMSGELLEIKDQTLTLASLDGHRISMRKIELKESFDELRIIVPGKALNEISKILTGDYEDNVLLSFSKNHIIFEFEQTVVVSRLIEGEYFRIEKMFSRDYETKVAVNRREFFNCVERSTLLIRETDKKPIVIQINDEFMNLKVNSALGSLNEEIEIEKKGKDLMIGFNPRFIIDALRSIEDETIYLYFVNAKAPCIIRNEEDSYLYLVLPINFNNVY